MITYHLYDGSEIQPLKPLKDILYSPRFLREISFLLFFFAIISGVYGVAALVSRSDDGELLAIGIGGLLQAIIYAVLAFFISRGSIIALWIAGILFVLDTLLQILEPSGALIFRGLLIFLLIRHIKRARAEA